MIAPDIRRWMWNGVHSAIINRNVRQAFIERLVTQK